MMKMENLYPLMIGKTVFLIVVLTFITAMRSKAMTFLMNLFRKVLMFSKWEISKKAEDSIMKEPKVG